MMESLIPGNLLVILMRLLLAFIAGAVMGLERERYFKDMNAAKGAGFRTYTLTCFGSCLFGLVSIYGFPAQGNTIDPGRIAAQVVAGVGFLGAGAIIKNGPEVKGLTTAAGMWTASAIGLMLAAGMYLPALVAAVLAYIVLDFHHLFPRMFETRKRYRMESFTDQTPRLVRKVRSMNTPHQRTLTRRRRKGTN